jgi:tripartite-type tricarboxylate transporter receptor subunit TctC
MKAARILAALAVGALAATGAFAQSYPVKPVRVIEPFGARSGVDMIARALTEKLSELWAQPVTVENHAGAGGTMAPVLVAKSLADGYTLLANSSAQAVSAAFLTNLAYDPLNDFISIAPIASVSYVYVVGKPSGVKTVAELIAAAKARPGQLKFGSAGQGTGTHLGAEKFNLEAGIKLMHVPTGVAEAMADTIDGRVTYWLSPISLALPHIHEGRLLALAVSSARRSSQLPGIPTVAEAGLAGFDYAIWYGMWAPAATPADVVNKIASDITRVLATPDLRDRLVSASKLIEGLICTVGDG